MSLLCDVGDIMFDNSCQIWKTVLFNDSSMAFQMISPLLYLNKHIKTGRDKWSCFSSIFM